MRADILVKLRRELLVDDSYSLPSVCKHDDIEVGWTEFPLIVELL
jgi:hypothetical protein